MHALALVIIPNDGDPAAHVERLMAPHQEDYDDDTERLTGWWDWFQIGGRFTGKLDGYDPNVDPANMERCFICGGSGHRDDMVVANGCNGCRGEGRRVKWPTQWKRRDGDVQPASLLRLGDPLDSYAILTEAGCVRRDGTDADGGWIRRPDEDYAAEATALLDATDLDATRVVLVDFHD